MGVRTGDKPAIATRRRCVLFLTGLRAKPAPATSSAFQNYFRTDGSGLLHACLRHPTASRAQRATTSRSQDQFNRPLIKSSKEGAMSQDDRGRDRPGSDQLHPLVYMAIIGLVLWFVLSVWGFAADGYTDYLLAVVSGFMVVAVAIPLVMWRSARKHQRPKQAGEKRESLGEWAAGEFETWQDRVKGTNAAIEVLLPIAAIAFGMTAFGIVLHFTAHGAS
jgi:hypothetical protein